MRVKPVVPRERANKDVNEAVAYYLKKYFPYVVFHIEHENRIDVWRVLHTRRDIPALVRDPLEQQ